MSESNFLYSKCAQFASNSDQFEEGELIYITEKLHGASCYILYYPSEDRFELTTKNQAKKDLKLTENATNKYWVALNRQIEIFKAKSIRLESECSDVEVIEIACELLPVQKGFTYGYTEPTLRAFGAAAKIRNEGWKRFNYLDLKVILGADLMVPVFWDGYFRKADIPKYIAMAEGKETVSGKELHIKEGVVVAPIVPRKDKSGTYLSMKILNTKYKNDGEELS